MNGALTLVFIIIMVMCIIGFLIYWILSIKSRTLQFGILRAMGMKFREIIMMIVYEQLLVSGVAIFAAIFIGGVTSDLFVLCGAWQTYKEDKDKSGVEAW